jgi:hypothetical protein
VPKLPGATAVAAAAFGFYTPESGETMLAAARARLKQYEQGKADVTE